MKKLSLNEMEASNGGKFIGQTEICGPCVLGIESCYVQGYLFFIPTSRSEPYNQEC